MVSWLPPECPKRARQDHMAVFVLASEVPLQSLCHTQAFQADQLQGKRTSTLPLNRMSSKESMDKFYKHIAINVLMCSKQ